MQNLKLWNKHLLWKTLVDPRQQFYGIWENYMFLISFISGLYSTYMACFVTTPGEGDASFVDACFPQYLCALS